MSRRQLKFPLTVGCNHPYGLEDKVYENRELLKDGRVRLYRSFFDQCNKCGATFNTITREVGIIR